MPRPKTLLERSKARSRESNFVADLASVPKDQARSDLFVRELRGREEQLWQLYTAAYEAKKWRDAGSTLKLLIDVRRTRELAAQAHTLAMSSPKEQLRTLQQLALTSGDVRAATAITQEIIALAASKGPVDAPSTQEALAQAKKRIESLYGREPLSRARAGSANPDRTAASIGAKVTKLQEALTSEGK